MVKPASAVAPVRDQPSLNPCQFRVTLTPSCTGFMSAMYMRAGGVGGAAEARVGASAPNAKMVAAATAASEMVDGFFTFRPP